MQMGQGLETCVKTLLSVLKDRPKALSVETAFGAVGTSPNNEDGNDVQIIVRLETRKDYFMGEGEVNYVGGFQMDTSEYKTVKGEF